MRITVVGSGDAFGSGGRFNTSSGVETARARLLIDCSASSPVALKIHGLNFDRVDGVILSHLHGDHFGRLPFLLLDAQLVSRRERPLVIAGPPGNARANRPRAVAVDNRAARASPSRGPSGGVADSLDEAKAAFRAAWVPAP